MGKIPHDPLEYMRMLKQLLISDKKRIGFLFGAGTSLAKKNDKSITVPGISKLTEIIENKLCENPLNFYLSQEIMLLIFK